MRVRHFSARTEQCYARWIVRFVGFCRMRHPSECGDDEVKAFVAHLANERRVSASTQNQAIAALVFLYREVLRAPLAGTPGTSRAKRPVRVPNVLTAEDVARVFDHLRDDVQLVAQLMYGAGLRLMEAVSIRIKDVGLDAGVVTVRGGTGDKDRRTVLPQRLIEPLLARIHEARLAHARDRARGGGYVALPEALRKL